MRWRKGERGERGREREELIIIVKCKKLSVRPSLKRYKNKSLEKTRRLFGSSREKISCYRFFEQLDQSRARDAQRYGRLVSGPCNVGNTSSHTNTEVWEHWAWIVLGWRPFGNSRCCWQKPMPGSIAGAC